MAPKPRLEGVDKRDDTEDCRDCRQNRVRLEKRIVKSFETFRSAKQRVANEYGLGDIGDEKQGSQNGSRQHQSAMSPHAVFAYVAPPERKADGA